MSSPASPCLAVCQSAGQTADDVQHDAQLDYYGKRLATCSSDKTVRIFNVVKGEAKGEPIILKGCVACLAPSMHNGKLRLMTRIGTQHQCGSSLGRILRSAPSSLRALTTAECSSGRRSGRANRPAVEGSCKMDGRGSKSTRSTPQVVSLCCATCLRDRA